MLFDGVIDIFGSASPHVVPLPWSDPAGLDPEEAFVSSIASCHMLWFLALAAKDGWCVDSYRDNAEGVMQKNANGKLFVSRVTLRPVVVFSGPGQPDSQAITTLHHRAHDECFIANSILTEVLCEPVLAAAG
jgi:organic hydroperoxide reductase OsmC/OhrA